MSTTRRRRQRAPEITYNETSRYHLETGDCLLPGPEGKSCDCGLIGPDGEQRMDLIRRMWQAHRDEILAGWKGKEPPWAAQFE